MVALEKGVRNQKCTAPVGPFRLLVPDPFFGPTPFRPNPKLSFDKALGRTVTRISSAETADRLFTSLCCRCRSPSTCRFQHLRLSTPNVRVSPGQSVMRAIGIMALAAVLGSVVRGQPAREPPAGGSTRRWTLVEADCQPHVLLHLRQSQPTCDQLQIRAGHGTSALVQWRLGPATVIDELKLHVPLKADRAGLQVLARVVLPRTIDPETGPTAHPASGRSALHRPGEVADGHAE